MHGKDAVLVVGEIGELVTVLPHPLIGGVEEVRAVFVHFNSGGGVRLGVGIAAEVIAALHNEHLLSQLASGPFRNGQAKESGTNNDEVIRSHGSHFIALQRGTRVIGVSQQDSQLSHS